MKSKDSEHTVMSERSKKASFTCFTCGKVGYKTYLCLGNSGEERQTSWVRNRWCETCISRTHDTKCCKKKNFLRVVCNNDEVGDLGEDEDVRSHNFDFKAICNKPDPICSDTLLVYCGATTHIITDKSKFVKFDEKFEPASHTIEIEDSSRTTDVVSDRGVAIKLCDTYGNTQEVELKNELYIPSYKQETFSVKAVTKKSAKVVFTPEHAELIPPDGTEFGNQTHQKLYFLKSMSEECCP